MFDEKTGEIKKAPVEFIETPMRDNVYEVYLEDGLILKPTANHPFYTKEKGWATIDGLDSIKIGAGQLEIGDHVYSLQQDGTLKEIKIIDIIPVRGNYLSYDLVNMKYSTFLAEDIVVHNCFMSGTGVTMADGSKKNIEDIKIGEEVKVFNEKNNTIENATVNSIQTKHTKPHLRTPSRRRYSITTISKPPIPDQGKRMGNHLRFG